MAHLQQNSCELLRLTFRLIIPQTEQLERTDGRDADTPRVLWRPRYRGRRPPLAEDTGFEPVRQVSPPAGLANQCIKPLCQSSRNVSVLLLHQWFGTSMDSGKPLVLPLTGTRYHSGIEPELLTQWAVLDSNQRRVSSRGLQPRAIAAMRTTRGGYGWIRTSDLGVMSALH